MCNLTRKHFKALAKMVRDMRSINPTERESLARKLADFCEGQNPLFDRIRFLMACGCVLPDTQKGS